MDAVVDKDRAAAILAADIDADLLMILTDVDAVYEDWGLPSQRRLERLTTDERRQACWRQAVSRHWEHAAQGGGCL